MLLHDRRWKRALAEHDEVISTFLVACQRVAPDDWHREPAPGKWSVAAIVLHICRAYELGRDAGDGGASMRMRVTPRVAWWSRKVLLPLMLATKRFPTGVRAPREVAPDVAEAQLLAPDDAASRVRRAAADGVASLRRAADVRPMPTFTHAYFGELAPYTALRLLSAHTRHHTRQLVRLGA